MWKKLEGNCRVEDGSSKGDCSMVDRCAVDAGSTAERKGVYVALIVYRNTPNGNSVYM